ncbi:Glutamyl aminopeptidase [Willisornis vidua]|uniref:glutamyl aminopeptidase n=1 Tax=Willisornis vidua TaxID=1566151 RepID=A0ABQ9CW79_9PASS|nr:Glutamyl aminopeptidase [Willisornis vidua]
MEGMDFEDRKSKRYCMKTKHVAIICGVVVIVGLAVGLGVGLSRPKSQKPSEGTDQPTTDQPTTDQPHPPVDLGPCPPKDDDTGDWRHFRLPTYVKPIHYDLEIKPEMEADTYSGTVNISIALEKPTSYLWLHLRETKITEMPTLQKSSGQQITVNDCFEYNPQEYIVMKAAAELPVTGENDPYMLTLKFQGWLNGSLVGFYRTTYTENGQIKSFTKMSVESGERNSTNRKLINAKKETHRQNEISVAFSQFQGVVSGYAQDSNPKMCYSGSIAATDHEPTDARKSFPCFDEPNKKATYNISIIHQDVYQALSNMPVQQTIQLGGGWNRTTFEKSVPMSTYLVCFAVHQFAWEERISASGKRLRVYAQPQQIHTAQYAANVTKVVFDFFEKYFNMSYSLPKLDKIAIPDFGTGAMENWGLITYRETNLLYDPEESATSNKQRVAAVIAHELVHQWFGNIVTMDWWDDLWLNEGFASYFEFLGANATEPDWQMLEQVLIDDVLPVMKDDSLLSSHPIVVDVSSPAEITSVFDGISYSKAQTSCDTQGASILRMIQDWITPELFQKGCQVYLKKYQFQNAKTQQFWEALEEASNKPVKEVMDTWTRQMGYPVLEMGDNLVLTQKRFLLDPNANASHPPSDLGYKWNIPVKTGLGNSTSYTFYNASDSAGITVGASSDTFVNINTDHIGFYRVNYDSQNWARLSSLLFLNHKNFSVADRAGILDDVFSLARLLRASVLDFACSMGDPDSLKNASDLFNQWLQGKPIAANLRLIVYRYGMQNSGNETSWNYMFQKYQETTLAQEKEKLLYGLASVKNITLLDRYLKYISTSLIKSQDVFTVLRYISYNTYGKTMAWDWIRLNWQYLVDRFTINDRTLGRIVTITQNFNTELQLWQMENFFEKYPNAGAGELPRSQSLEQVKSNIKWLKENKEEIQMWLEAQQVPQLPSQTATEERQAPGMKVNQCKLGGEPEETTQSAQDTVGFLVCKQTLLGHVELLTHQHASVQPVFLLGKNTMCRTLALVLIELDEVYPRPPLKLVKVLLDGILSLQHVDCTTELGVVSKLSEGALNPTVHVADKDVKWHWSPYQPLKNLSSETEKCKLCFKKQQALP